MKQNKNTQLFLYKENKDIQTLQNKIDSEARGCIKSAFTRGSIIRIQNSPPPPLRKKK